ncbi:hypothetical protein Ddc_05086 [Ditylenchus destructor]|nr:hypothetical protein Ddc_05086 [Ditylenchus destructor]
MQCDSQPILVIVLLILCYIPGSLETDVINAQNDFAESLNGSFEYYAPMVHLRVTLSLPVPISDISSTMIIGVMQGNSESRSKWQIAYELYDPSSDSLLSAESMANNASTFLGKNGSLVMCRTAEEDQISLEIEVQPNSLIVRSQDLPDIVDYNQYSFPTFLRNGESFQLYFLWLQANSTDNSVENSCLLKATIEPGEQVPTTPIEQIKSFNPNRYAQYDNYIMRRRKPKLPRRTTATTKKPREGQQFATKLKNLDNRIIPTPDASPEIEQDSQIIDILKDRKIYEEIQQSKTNAINCVWSNTFLVFFVVEVVLIGLFVTFGISMFILLQCRPKNQDKHVGLFD